METSSVLMTEKPDCFKWYSIKSTISFSSSIIRIVFVLITLPVNVYQEFSTERIGKQYLQFNNLGSKRFITRGNFFLWVNSKREGMLAKIPYLIGSEDLKLYLLEIFGCGNSRLK